jgi:hypothetical protein
MELSSVGSTSPYSYCPVFGASNASEKCAETSSGTGHNEELSDEETREVNELKKRDKEVKAHETAHVAAGGAYVRGGASFEYQVGPDGKKYAVGGEVSIDTSAVAGDPQATIRKMQVVKAAALAPAQPSGADRAIAAKASMEAGKAQAEQVKSRQEASQSFPSDLSGKNKSGFINGPTSVSSIIDIKA